MQKWHDSHEYTLESFAGSNMKQISIFMILKTNYFQMLFLSKSDLRLSTTGKYTGTIRIKKLLKRQY